MKFLNSSECSHLLGILFLFQEKVSKVASAQIGMGLDFMFFTLAISNGFATGY